MFDMSAFDTVSAANKGATLHLTVPKTGEPAYNGDTPLTITILGSDSDEFAKAVQAKVRANRRKKNNTTDDIDIQKATIESCELYAAMTIGWTGIPDDSGKKLLEFSKENAFKLYMKYKDIRVQVGNFMDKKENFLPD